MKKEIHIPARRKRFLTSSDDPRPVIRVSRNAYNALVEIYNESSLSMSQVASEIIIQGKDLVVYDKEES